jgi:hypothetical protein
MSIYIPSNRNLCYSIIGAIASHALIQDPPIYYPVTLPGQNKQQIKINKYRTYGGIELMNVTNSNLTCAVYPAYVPRNVKTGHPSTERDNQKSITYTPYELSKSSPTNDVKEKVTYRFVVELHYHDVSVSNGTATINFANANPFISNVFNTISPDNFSYLYTGNNNDTFSEPISNNTVDQFISNNSGSSISSSSLVVDINPGEEVLRDYMELLRIVLNQTKLQPFGARNLIVRSIDFPTSNWLEDSKNVYFHLAYLILDLELYLPCTNYLFSSPEVVQAINITDS